MSIGAAVLWIIVGLVLLVLGGDWLVRGATRIATFLGIPPIVIGLTIVAFGTSAPELAVGVVACTQGEVDLAFGNVVGSNIFNTLFILGISAVIVPLSIEKRLIRFDIPFMILITVATFLLAWDGVFSRQDAIGFYLALAFYLFMLGRATRNSSTDSGAEPADANVTPSETDAAIPRKLTGAQIVMAIVFLVAGLVLLLIGSNSIVSGAVALARKMGLSELLIGATIIAAGTSLPEVAASLIAACKGERDLAVGNVVGSNILNLALILSTCGLVASSGLPIPERAMQVDLPLVVAAAVICWPIVLSKRSIGRAEGGLLFGGYITYMTLQILDATSNQLSETITFYCVKIIAPLLTIALCLFAGWEVLRDRRRKKLAIEN